MGPIRSNIRMIVSRPVRNPRHLHRKYRGPSWCYHEIGPARFPSLAGRYETFAVCHLCMDQNGAACQMSSPPGCLRSCVGLRCGFVAVIGRSAMAKFCRAPQIETLIEFARNCQQWSSGSFSSIRPRRWASTKAIPKAITCVRLGADSLPVLYDCHRHRGASCRSGPVFARARTMPQSPGRCSSQIHPDQHDCCWGGDAFHPRGGGPPAAPVIAAHGSRGIN